MRFYCQKEYCRDTDGLHPESTGYRYRQISGAFGRWWRRKTSLIFRIMEELTAVGKKVLITTTTHMAYEPDRPFAEDGDMISIKQNLEECGYTIVASLDREKRKIGALSEEKLKEIKVLADVMLIEADGAKRYPLKVPASWEPVIWGQTDLVIAVAGLDAVGEPICKVCHRSNRVADFLEKRQKRSLQKKIL